MIIERYTPEYRQEWDRFIDDSKNGTFLLKRSYMDYHADRFHDFSLICRDKGGHIAALFPANGLDDTIYSHQGLTYGGLVMSRRIKTVEVMEAFESINGFLRDAHFSRVIYKPVPSIYHTLPADEDLFAITNVCNASIKRRMLSSVIDLDNKLPWRQNRRTALNKARQNGIVVYESDDYAGFWSVLCDNLKYNHDSKPVHSLCEILRLKQDNPGNIQLLISEKDGIMLGGILIFTTPNVVRTQYISATEEGKAMGAVDIIMEHIISTSRRRFLDIGTSAGEHGELLNTTLLFQKEGFGARGICFDTYEWEL